MKKYILILLFVYVCFQLRNLFKKDTYNFSALEINRNAIRQEYLGSGLGKIYKNRFGVYYFNYIYPKQMKLESIMFSELGNKFIYIPVFGLLIYFGYKRNLPLRNKNYDKEI